MALELTETYERNTSSNFELLLGEKFKIDCAGEKVFEIECTENSPWTITVILKVTSQ